MSSPECSVRHHRRQTDRAIHHAFAHLATDPIASRKFLQLLHCVRTRAPRLLQAPVRNSHHPGVDALIHLARFHAVHLRPVSGWEGTTASWRPAIASLAHHLVCTYHVPAFLTSAWYATGPGAETQRGWFVAHSRGASFRSLRLPIPITRKMEHIFLGSPDHLSVESALRRAELLALGAPPAFVRAVLATQAAADLSHSDFWRSVWLFLVNHATDVDPAQIGPIIDYLQAVRHHRRTAESPEGIVELAPLLPAFSMKGRTVKSVLRLVHAWHRGLGQGGGSLSWTPSPIQPLLFEEPRPDPSEPPRRWLIAELTSSAELRSQGSALHHCVAGYASRCSLGASSIWSLRLLRGENLRSLLTIEVDPHRRAVVQARGLVNRPAAGKPLRLLRHWAAREKLQIAI